MARSSRNVDGEIAPSEVSLRVDKGARLPKFDAAEVADFAAEACDRIVALNPRSRKRATSRVDVLVTSNREMQRLNRDFRRKDKSTDVISFPVAEKNGHALEGDIAISAEITAQNARKLGHSAAEELKILILHGMLHLAGYDHETDRGQMAKLEAELRRELRLPGSLISRVPQPPSAVRGAKRRSRSTR